MTTALSGMKAIRDYCRSVNLSSSEASVIQMIRDCGFPARKLGGVWESDREVIDLWRKRYVTGLAWPPPSPEIPAEGFPPNLPRNGGSKKRPSGQ